MKHPVAVIANTFGCAPPPQRDRARLAGAFSAVHQTAVPAVVPPEEPRKSFTTLTTAWRILVLLPVVTLADTSHGGRSGARYTITELQKKIVIVIPYSTFFFFVVQAKKKKKKTKATRQAQSNVANRKKKKEKEKKKVYK